MDSAIIAFMKSQGYEYDAKTKQFVKPNLDNLFNNTFEMFDDIFGKKNENKDNRFRK